MFYVLVTLAIFGHWAICIYTINRLHATALPHRLMKNVDLLWYVFLFVIPAIAVGSLFFDASWTWFTDNPTLRMLGMIYAICCWTAVPFALWAWIRYLLQSRVTPRLESNHTRQVDIVQCLGAPPSGSLSTNLISQIPGNQVFQLWVHEKVLRLRRLPAELDGLSITHITDLHFTGRVTSDFFRLVVREAMQLKSDMVIVTGDIIDNKECFGWISEVLGPLDAPLGVYFVLGNHDLRIDDEAGLRAELVRQGFIDLGGRYHQLEVNGRWILLAGNELPWFAPAADMSQAPVESSTGRPFRIAAAHSPDQLAWAKDYDIDLLLAGHTHGGQIRFPLIGPVFSPSHYGVRYTGGTYDEPPTLMHVSRGLSGTRPLRFNCAPELTKLVLRPDGS